MNNNYQNNNGSVNNNSNNQKPYYINQSTYTGDVKNSPNNVYFGNSVDPEDRSRLVAGKVTNTHIETNYYKITIPVILAAFLLLEGIGFGLTLFCSIFLAKILGICFIVSGFSFIYNNVKAAYKDWIEQIKYDRENKKKNK